MNPGRTPGADGLWTPLLESYAVGVAITVAMIFAMPSGLQPGVLNDDGVYLSLGKALAEGNGYVSIHLAGQPVHEKYPPGFPFLLAFLWRIVDSLDEVMLVVRGLNALAVGATSALIWGIGRTRFGVARPLLACLTLTPLLLDASVQYLSIPLSEPWYMLGWALALTCWTHAEQQRVDGRVKWLVITGLVVAATVLTRSHGIVLLPALAAGLAFGSFSRPERLAALAATIGPLLGWHAYHSVLIRKGPRSDLPDETSYTTWFQPHDGYLESVWNTVSVNVESYVEQIGPYLSGYSTAGMWLAAVYFLATVVGSLLSIRRNPVLGISVLGAIGIVVLWPFAQDRLILFVLPFAGLALACVIAPHESRSSNRVRGGIGWVALLSMALIVNRQMSVRAEANEALAQKRPPSLFSPGYVLQSNSRFVGLASPWILANTDSSDRIMIDNHSGIYLRTGRTTIPASPAESRLQPSVFRKPGRYLAGHILRDSLDYVIVGVPNPGIMRDIQTVQARCPEALRWGGVRPTDPRSILRVWRDEGCLETILGNTEEGVPR